MEKSNNLVLSTTVDWIVNLRVLATISVIFLHVASSVTAQYGNISNLSWWTANFYNSAVRFCVPIFVMISGALLLNRNYTINDFLKKKLSRILIPFAFWSIVYLGFLILVEISKGKTFSFVEVVSYIFSLIQNGIYPHFWYVYMIVGVYLFIPIINRWIQNVTQKELQYFLVIWFFTIAFNFPYFSKYAIDFNLNYFSGYIGFLVLGYYLSNFENKKTKSFGLFLTSIGFLLTLFGTGISTVYKGNFEKSFYEYLTPNVALMSVGIFIYFKNFTTKNNWFTPLKNAIAKYSFGIYFVHNLILIILNKFDINGNLVHPIVGIPLTTLICLTISFVVIYMLNKINFGRNIVG